MKHLKTTSRVILGLTLLMTIIGGSFLLAIYVRDSAAAQLIINQFGYLGVLMLAIIGGLSAFIPIPAASFTPVFVSAGLALPIIIMILVLGTMIADFTGYIFGRWGRDLMTIKYPRTYAVVTTIVHDRRRWLPFFITAYAAVIPFPNEAIIIPLAVSGIRFEHMFIPLIIGNVINQTAIAYGTYNIFSIWF